MDHVRPVPDGAPEGAPSGDNPAQLRRPAPAGGPGRRERPSPRSTTRRRPGPTAWRSAWSATRRTPRRSPRRPTSTPGGPARRYDAGRGSAVGWLLTIVHRKAVDRVRSVEAATSRDETWNRETAPTDHDQTSEAAHASLDAARVRGAVATLTDVQRQAVELTYFGGYTHTEVATLLDVPLGTAKTRIRDGLIRLRDLMGVAS